MTPKWKILLSVALACSFAVSAQDNSSNQDAAKYKRLVDRYCVTCHNEVTKSGYQRLDNLNFEDLHQNSDTWEKVIHKLRTNAMPPPDQQQPSRGAKQSLLTWLVTAMDNQAAESPNPGRPAIYRLNRSEYENAIRDLLAVEIDATRLLPPDGSDFGFDNIADSLTVSSMSLERYLIAAGQISKLALGESGVKPSLKTYSVSRILVQDNRLSEDPPFGARGGTSVRHYFPLDGEYIIKPRVGGSRSPQQIDVRIDGVRVALFDTATPSVKGKGSKKKGGAAPMEIRFNAKAGTRTIAISLLKKTLAREDIAPDWLPPAGLRGPQTGGGPGLSSFTILGPYNPTGTGTERPSLDKIFVCTPETEGDETSCANQIIANLARNALRRPVTQTDIDEILPFYHQGRAEGSFETGIQWVIERILVDPEFLFRIERDPENIAPDTAYPLSDLELASRLSFFLWSSIPDEELLSIAEKGELRDPEVLDTQIARMLKDKKSESLVTNFAAQWLHLRNIPAATPDLNLFPEFDDNLRDALEQETHLLVASQLKADKSVLELLTADYTFVNERLANHYGIPNIYGSRFRRVQLEDPNRHGLLGQGGILTVTSYATRTSPVKRGKWLLENILGSPPPAPPPDVPALPEADEMDVALSVRERMEQHRADPLCASCHLIMDPLGFSLENFDGIGKWRDYSDGNTPIDSMADLPDGTTLYGPAGLRENLLTRRDDFAANVTEKLLTYAIGRGVEHYDKPAIRKIVNEASPHDYTWSSIIRGIINSTPFQMRRSSS